MRLTAQQVTSITGQADLSISTASDSGCRRAVLDRLDSTSEILTGHLTTYGRFATIVAADPDWPFMIRVLRQCRMAADELTDQSDIDAFHLEPPTTGHEGWDAILAGVAEITGTDRVSDRRILAWCRHPDRFLPELFDVLDTGKYRWVEYLRTPVLLRERGIILAAGNLEGV